MRFLASTEGLCLAPEMNNGVYVQLRENITEQLKSSKTKYLNWNNKNPFVNSKKLTLAKP